MQAETKTVVYVIATILLIVASSFAGLGYFANQAVIARAGSTLANAPDVHLVQQRAEILLVAAIAFWVVASLLFARVIPQRPGRGARSYVTSTFIVGIAVVATVFILRTTATMLKMF